MVTKNAEPSQAKKSGDGDTPPPPSAPPAGPPVGPSPGAQPDNRASRGDNAVFKSGPLFISSKGIGWTSWKKRWFILTHTSLVFFRSDPSAILQKASEVNLTLGGIDLNNSGSVIVKADKKLLTVLFPDGRDGRAFTLKAETLEDLFDWKTALENALAQAPSTASVMGQNGILKNNKAEAADGSLEQSKEKVVKFPVIGRPILLALEDVDGGPSFLEKALRFMEEHGVKAEGILRQAADVDDVNRRIREFEQGKTEFSPGEDAHVVADCVKYFIRELPSSPIPASCCNALLEAHRTDRASRVNAMRTAICETFPEPNRHLLLRILMMMQTITSHKAQNRMSTSAVAACMAPLLLRPLLAGECEIETDFNVGDDGSAQLLQAVAAANHAQAIVITLLEEYDTIIGESSVSHKLYSDSEESGSETEEATDDDDEQDGGTQGSDAYTDDDLHNASSRSCSESGDTEDSVPNENKDFSTDSKSPERDGKFGVSQNTSSNWHQMSQPQHDGIKSSENIQNESANNSARQAAELVLDVSSQTSLEVNLDSRSPKSSTLTSLTISNGPVRGSKRPTLWGRTAAKKKLSMESFDYDDEIEIQRLEETKSDLQSKITDEVKQNEFLGASLERRKKGLQERQLALGKDVGRLQYQLHKERDKSETMEAGLAIFQGSVPIPHTIDKKIKLELGEIAQAEIDIINLKQKVDDLAVQLNQRLEKNYEKTYGSARDSSNQHQKTSAKLKDKQSNNKAAATTSQASGRSARKDSNLDGSEESENEKKRESTSLPNKHPPQNQLQVDSIHTCNSGPTAPVNSKKSGTKSEGNSASFALTKLTTRLNFLKERHSQIANELQKIDKSRGSGQASLSQDKGRGSEPQQSTQNPDRSWGSKAQSIPQSEKDREPDSSQSLQNQDKRVGMEGQSIQQSVKSSKSNMHPLQNVDGGKRSDALRPQTLDRKI